MRAYVINILIVLIIFPVILQSVINAITLSIEGQGANASITQTASGTRLTSTGMIMQAIDQEYHLYSIY